MAVTKIHAIKTTLGKAVNYITNPEKTEYSQLVSGYNCSPDSAELEFAMTAQLASKSHNAGTKTKNPNLAYHLIQSFSPNDNVTPEQAHELGKQLANRFLEGKYEYVISTHADKNHIHNHIIINATSWLTLTKLQTKPFKTAARIRAISDQLCIANDLSVIGEPGKLGYSYKEWYERRNKGSWKAELRKRLNFILARATSYDQFLAMCRELDVAVDDQGKHIKYRLRDLNQDRWTRGNKLADTEHYTLDGVKDLITENAQIRKILWSSIMEEVEPAHTWSDFVERLWNHKGIKITEGKTGLIFHLPDGRRKKGAELGAGFSKSQLEKAIHETDYIPGDEPEVSPREQWEKSAQGKNSDAAFTPVTLLPENIEKISLDGLLIKIPQGDQMGKVFLDSSHVDFDPETGTYTGWIGSGFRYYAVKDDLDPDLPESDQLGQEEIRGETMIRALERENGVTGAWVDVPAEYIRSAGPERLILSFPQDGVSSAFIDSEDVQFSPAGCKIRVYDNWTYARGFRGVELRNALGGNQDQKQTGVINSMWRKYRSFERRNQQERTKALSKVLMVMEREKVQDLRDFPIKSAALSAQIEARRSHIKSLTQKRNQYAMAHRYLEAVRTYGTIHDRIACAKGWAKTQLQQSYGAELELYNTAVRNLQAMNVHITVEPEKVAGMMDSQADEIRRYQAEIKDLDERLEEVAAAESIVKEILGQEESNQIQDQQQIRLETRSQENKQSR